MRYRKVSSAFWADERVRRFSDDGRLAFLYLLTHPAMTSIGAMRGTIAGLASELGWTRGRLERALTPAIEARMIEVNAPASYLALPNFLRHNAPESPNVCKAWATALATLPECPQRLALVERCRTYLATGPFREAFEEALGKAFPEAFREHFRKGLPNPEQEQEQEQEQEGSPQTPLASPSALNGTGRTARRVKL